MHAPGLSAHEHLFSSVNLEFAEPVAAPSIKYERDAHPPASLAAVTVGHGHHRGDPAIRALRRAAAGGPAGQPAAPPPTLGPRHGTLDFDTPDFTLKLVKDSQTIAALQPKGAKGMDANTPFDFTPADQLTARQGDRFNHLGDITLRVKQAAGRTARGSTWRRATRASR